MIRDQSVLAVITARGGSKGLPGKNIRYLAGKPLIAWTIEAAQTSRYIDRLILSTDDEQIIKTAQEWNCEVPFVRDPSIATDTASTIDVVLDAIHRVPGYDWIVVLQPTSPCRITLDIDECIEETIAHGSSIGISVCEASKSPFWMYGRGETGLLETLVPTSSLPTQRQNLPIAYQLNGAAYVMETKWFQQHKKFLSPETFLYVMPKERSIDIDDELDLLLAEQILMSCTANNAAPIK